MEVLLGSLRYGKEGAASWWETRARFPSYLQRGEMPIRASEVQLLASSSSLLSAVNSIKLQSGLTTSIAKTTIAFHLFFVDHTNEIL